MFSFRSLVGKRNLTLLYILYDPRFVLQKFLDAVKLEPDSDSEPDPLPDMKHDELAIPTSPVVLKNEEVVRHVSFSSL